MRETILIISNTVGGLFMFRRELIETLSKNYTIEIIASNKGYINDLEKLGCHVISSPIDRRGTNPLNDIKLFRYYMKSIKRLQPLIVLTYTIKPNVYGGLACIYLRKPYISNITGLGTSIENGGFLSSISFLLYRIGLRKASCVIFQNETHRKMFVDNGLTKGKTRVVPGSGVNLKQHCAEPYPSEVDGIRFLFVGRIMKDKGIGELIEAFRVVHEKYPFITLDIAGSEVDDYSAVFREVEDMVHYIGFQRDMHPLYKNCHCAILPSYHEGTANAMLEASATARPVITTTVPGCRETFDEGITGFGCEAKNIESLIVAIEKFLSLTTERRKQMGLAARAKMEREYDRQIVIDAYKEEIELIERAANK